MKLTLKNKIMFGVYVMYALRKMRSPLVAETLVLATIAIVISAFVSVPSVIANMSNSASFYRYFMVAFSNTTVLVQMMLILAFATLVLSLRNFANMVVQGHLSSVGRAQLS